MIIKSIDDTRGYKGLPDGTRVNFDENITYIIGDNYKTKSTILSVPLWVITGYSLSEGNQEDVSDDNRPNLRNVTAQITIIDNEGEEHSIFRSKGKSNYVLLDGVKTSREALSKFYKDIQFFLCAYNPYRFRSMEKDKQKELLLRLLPNIEKEEVFSCLTEEEQNILGEPILDAKEYNKEKRVKIKEIEFEIKRNEGIKESNLLTALKVERKEKTFDKQMELLDLEAQYENLLKGGIGAFNLEDIKNKINLLERKLSKILKEDLVNAKEKKKKIEEKINNVSSVNSECPVCKQKIVNEALRKALERQYNKELETLENSIENLKQEAKNYLTEMNSKKALFNKLNTSENKEKLENINTLKEQIDSLKEEKLEIELYNQKAETENEEIRNAKSQIEKVEDAIKKLTDTKELYEKQIEVANKFRKLKIEKQVKMIQNLLDKVTIEFYKVDTSTGEIIDDNKYTVKYNGREYEKLSHSQKMRADFEISNLINELANIHTPMFIDDAESIRDVNIKTNNQVVVAIFIKYSELKVLYDYHDVLEAKKASVDEQLREDRNINMLNAA